tara:strand:- start:1831 stop:2718 length:888 start_codon:yes stop_codon:yes gene_type:complete
MLSIEKIVKNFDNLKAVDQISFKVKRGDIYGFLGPNGAGKTTTIRMIMGIMQPDSGLIMLNGDDINSLGRKNLGYLPEDRGLYQKQKLQEILHYFGLLRGMKKKDVINKTRLWLERFNLDSQGLRKVEELSKGNQQKIQFILALLHDPELIILDEPFTGLDPLNQLLMKDIIQEKQNEGKTIIFSTHQMEQVEKLCNNICLINNGRIVLEGPLESIRNNYSTNAVEVKFLGDFNKIIVDEYFSEWTIKDNVLDGILQKPTREFINWINMNSDIKSFQIKIPTLEQIFIEEVKKTA